MITYTYKAKLNAHTPNRSEIRRKQRALRRRKPGSERSEKRRQALTRTCDRARVLRHNAIHCLTNDIINNHGKWIAMEELDI